MPITSCAQCSAPLADDQRYCLQCGEPRPTVSGPLTRPLGVPTTALVPPAPPALPGSGAKGPQMRNNSLALIAGVGVLLLAMGVGVLIGRAGVGSAKTPPAQVISLGSTPTGVSGASSTTPAIPTPTTETPSTPSANKSKATQAPKKDSSSIDKPAPSSTAKNLRSGGSGESYEQKSKNLPDVVSTG